MDKFQKFGHPECYILCWNTLQSKYYKVLQNRAPIFM
jgi:hypothetical protein